jgi:hypothetical protein
MAIDLGLPIGDWGSIGDWNWGSIGDSNWGSMVIAARESSFANKSPLHNPQS